MFDLGVAHDEMAERLLEHHLACVGWIDRDPAKRRPRHLGPAMLRAGDVAAIIGIEGAGIFYREAGPKDAPTIVLLHGFSSSSREFNTLIPIPATRYAPHQFPPAIIRHSVADPEDFSPFKGRFTCLRAEPAQPARQR